jgi:lipid-binding SYLF domain-containing protein
MKAKVLVGVLALSSASSGFAAGLWDDVKSGVSGAVDAVSDAAVSVTKQESAAETRGKIDAMAESTLSRLFTENGASQGLYDKSYGYAVFDTRKFSFMITTGYGAGVAVHRTDGKRTYMKMATGGVNVGLGGEFFQLVLLFEDNAAFDRFVNEGFEAGGEASAVVGSDAQGVAARFVNGMAVYKLTEKGLKLAADISGTKYWKDDDLN